MIWYIKLDVVPVLITTSHLIFSFAEITISLSDNFNYSEGGFFFLFASFDLFRLNNHHCHESVSHLDPPFLIPCIFIFVLSFCFPFIKLCKSINKINLLLNRFTWKWRKHHRLWFPTKLLLNLLYAKDRGE